uniref:Tudor domain-containing protein n=1 Tax=Plectus sambesii TaxID=2011161 RepID=A0A914XCT6_9BILA
MADAGELESYRIQLQQVEAALLAEPENEELLKLQSDLTEVILLTEDLVNQSTAGSSAAEGAAGSKDKEVTEKLQWKVGDRCLAPSMNGQSYECVIDGISQEKVAVTFVGNGIKHMVKYSDLKAAPLVQKKTYIFESNATKNTRGKNEWQIEKERRRARAQKKAQRVKTLDDAKEGEKKKWQNFNSKAVHKSMKGFKRTTASGSAPDGPAGGPSSSASNRPRMDNIFQSTRRGNMESLF